MVVFKATKTAVILSIRTVFKFKAATDFVCWFKFRKSCQSKESNPSK